MERSQYKYKPVDLLVSFGRQAGEEVLIARIRDYYKNLIDHNPQEYLRILNLKVIRIHNQPCLKHYKTSIRIQQRSYIVHNFCNSTGLEKNF